MTSFMKIKTRQTGVALVTGLIFLVVMTIIVIAALRSSTLEERMAANARNRQLALQAAEAAMRDAEGMLFNGDLPATNTGYATYKPDSGIFKKTKFTTDCASGLCNIPADNTRWKTFDWDDAPLISAASKVNGWADGLQPRYLVEILAWPASPECKGTARITARGMGMDASIVYVQSVFKFQAASC
jgi:type IV pilus assembly protein PilX